MRPLRTSLLLWAFAPAFLLALHGGSLSVHDRPQKQLPEEVIVFTNDEGALHRLNVEMAVTPSEQEQGLTFRRSLPANAGMIFIFPKNQVVDFWMKDTMLPLDMIFIRKDGIVDSLAKDEAPFSLANRFSAGPVIAAVELPAGTAERLALHAGDKVVPAPFPSDDSRCCLGTAASKVHTLDRRLIGQRSPCDKPTNGVVKSPPTTFCGWQSALSAVRASKVHDECASGGKLSCFEFEIDAKVHS